MNYLHYPLQLAAGDIVEINLDSQANVMLLDDANYGKYENSKPFTYNAGGFATTSPVQLPAPRPGRWHLVIDLGGYAGSVQASVRTVQAAA